MYVLNVEVSEDNSYGHTGYLHNAVVDMPLSPDAVDSVQEWLNEHSDVTIAFSPVRPGEILYDEIIADWYQFQWFAVCDMHEEFQFMFLEAIDTDTGELLYDVDGANYPDTEMA